jgi:hypothetical protein
VARNTVKGTARAHRLPCPDPGGDAHCGQRSCSTWPSSYAVQSRLPTILSQLEHPASTAAAATAATTIGGSAAAAFIGTMMDKRGAFGTLGIVYLAGAGFIAVLALALPHAGATPVVAAAFLAGTCLTGGQMSVIALAAVLYPPRIRPAGVGWAPGAGRIGGIMGPCSPDSPSTPEPPRARRRRSDAVNTAARRPWGHRQCCVRPPGGRTGSRKGPGRSRWVRGRPGRWGGWWFRGGQ